MRRVLVIVVAVATAAVSGASAQRARTVGTLQLNTTFNVKFHQVDCPAATPATTGCYLYLGDGVVPGLGHIAETYTWMIDLATACLHTTFTPVVISVAGKGEIDASLTDPYACDPAFLSMSAAFPFTITGGTGAYAGATGDGTVGTSPVNETSPGVGSDTETWTGPLTVAGLDFDTTPPAIAGATSRLVKTKRAAGARVRYALTATDAVDGAVPVTCQPASGALFPLGRTLVTCAAADMSGNIASARFTVTVKRVR